MPELRQTTFNEVPGGGIAAPGEPHMACVLLLDTSGSMSGAPIDSLNKAINDFKELTSIDELAQNCVDIAIIEFNDTARVVWDFTPLTQLQPVTLSATGGCIAMGAGINLAIDKVKERKCLYNSLGTPSYQPWIVMVINGNPTDDISSAVQRIKAEERKKRLKFWLMGGAKCDLEKLVAVTRRGGTLDDNDFSKLFNWLTSFWGGRREHPKLEFPSSLHLLPQDWDW